MIKKLLLLLWVFLPVLAFAQPSNDDCANATLITPGSTIECVSSVNVSLQNATASALPVSCDGVADDDVWYRFTAINDRHSITTSNLTGTSSALRFEIFSGSCTGTLVTCGTAINTTILVDGLTAGTEYYIRIFTFITSTNPNPAITFDLCITTPPNSISINTTQYSVTQLVEEVLMPQTGFTISNITSYTGINVAATEPNGIGYFIRNGTDFPFENGVVLSSGNAVLAEGPNLTTQNGGAANWPGDTDLDAFLPGGNQVTRNATKLEFDFVPDVNQLNFNFLFASEEYGLYQCFYGDLIGIFLTDNATGITTNLAVVPFTNTPISTGSVRNAAYNSPGNTCPSANPAYFDAYYPQGTMTAATNFNGLTVAFTTEMPELEPGHSYHIKFVVADYVDAAFDSALFIQASTSEVPVQEIIVNGPESYYACDDNNDGYANFDLDTLIPQYLNGITPAGDYAVTFHQTHVDAVIDANPLPLSYTNIEAYGQTVYVRIESTEDPENYVIVYLSLATTPVPSVATDTINTLYTCIGVPVDVTVNVVNIPNIEQYQVTYHATIEDASENLNPFADPSAVVLTGSNNSVWVRVQNNDNIVCYEIIQQPIEYWEQYVTISISGTQAAVVFGNGIDPGNYSFSLDGTIQNGPAFSGLEYGEHIVTITNIGCGTVVALSFLILPDAPLGEATQTFTEGQTLADLEVEGPNIQWYATETGDTALAEETLLEDGETYYATQSANGYESTQRLAVTVNQVAGLATNIAQTLKYYPGPGHTSIIIENSHAIKTVTLYNTLGQMIYTAGINNNNTAIDISALAKGVYLLKIAADNGATTFRILIE
ncbi:choice-of-anchor L domain-containing protein [Flavobacterium sp. RHBU_24]|uniref:choice-of-anchor L domain-containing protein n=1 Tax=Flavobacterium sp. RHBU_24 TaxID=3391185 RepID=UPI003984B950